MKYFTTEQLAVALGYKNAASLRSSTMYRDRIRQAEAIVVVLFVFLFPRDRSICRK